jgi:signal transduction histidine kinase/ActR/RegA family two-component response regulator
MSGPPVQPEVEALRSQVSRLERINAAPMKRVERTVDESGSAYAIFEQNIVSQRVIAERTRELTETNQALKREISQRQRAVEAMRAALETAEAASAAKSQFLANVSHEIRTPMTAILGFLELLDPGADEGLSPADRDDAFRTIRRNARHLLTLIDEVLDLSKIEARQMRIESIRTDPLGIVHEVADLMRPQAIERGIGLEVRAVTPMPEAILTDPTRLRQVLCNLVGNAVKFTERGSVTVEAGCTPGGRLLEVRVIDTGIGMNPETLEKVRRFEAFNQGDDSMTRRFGGTGLGLRISAALTEQMGGSISVESEAGRGSVFTATFATGDAEEARTIGDDGHPGPRGEKPGEDAPPGHARPLEGRRIMLVEDGPDNRRLLGFLLRRAGATVVEAEHGRIAVDLIASGRAEPDLVLMDMQMPVLDGYGATRLLRERGVTLPIIALTAHAMTGDRERCLNAGCDGYMTKPIEKQELLDSCRAFIEQRPGGRRAA